MVTLRIYPAQSGDLSFQAIEIELQGAGYARRPVQTPAPRRDQPRLGVVLTGRAPIWLYGWLVHECHCTRWVACYDPRLGAVVVSSHHPEARVGQVINWEQAS